MVSYSKTSGANRLVIAPKFEVHFEFPSGSNDNHSIVIIWYYHTVFVVSMYNCTYCILYCKFVAYSVSVPPAS